MGIFDVSFSKFITPAVVKFVYIILMVLLGLGYLFAVIGGFSADVVTGLIALILGPVVVFLYLLLIRVSLEALVAVVRTAENTTELLRIQGGGGAAMAGPPQQPYGGPPPGQSPYGGQQPGPHTGPQPQQPPYGQQPPPQTPPPGFYPNQ
ncbi:DUF4282 domain-containing protein [Haloechinothrix salitolerans]|uniref:DUF4282 domain-containing protein n=1 Tax=Haloechinothrix salitolerans TaxID=926830 RepID=A0ABW2BS07_9PSEU